MKLNLEVNDIKDINFHLAATTYFNRLKEIKNFQTIDTLLISTFCEQIRVKVNKITLKNFQYELIINYGALDDCIQEFLNQ